MFPWEEDLYKDKKKQDSHHVKTYFEYFDKEGFRKYTVWLRVVVNFIYKREKPYDGILQKFMDPVGDRNCTCL